MGGEVLEGSWGLDLCHQYPPKARHVGRLVNPCFDWSSCGLWYEGEEGCKGEQLDGSGWVSALLEYFPYLLSASFHFPLQGFLYDLDKVSV